jgi:mannitol operon transcriptional antiterminator
MLLTSRSHKLICMILDSQEPVRIKDIARELQVSERTVKYDLETVRSWLQRHNIELQSQPHKGIWIEDTGIRNRLYSLLNDGQGIEVFLHPQERVKHLMLELLLQDSPMKINDLAGKLHVSRNTAISDLSMAENLLGNWNVYVERSRFGVQAVATEINRRLALENIIQGLFSGNDMFNLVEGIIQGSDIPLPVGRTMEKLRLSRDDIHAIFQAVKSMVNTCEKGNGVHFTDRMIIGIYIRLCIVIQRLRSNHEVVLESNEILSVKKLKIFSVLQEVLNDLSVRLGVNITDHEACFISQHMIGMILPATNEGTGDYYSLTVELISQVSGRTAIHFRDDALLFEHLLAHMTEKLTKYRHGVVDPNPLISDIIRSYPDLFHIVKQVCQDMFCKMNVHFSDSDIGYIVMHFLASLKRMQEMTKCKALVVCGTGRGTAQFLKIILEHEIRHLKIVGCCSVAGLERQIQLHKPDLVISVVNVQASVPIVVVNSIPNRQDLDSVREVITELRSRQNQKVTVDSPPSDLSSLEQFTQEVICKGFDLSRTILSEMKDYLSDQRAEGLALHLMLMVSRLAFGSAYDDNSVNHEWTSEPMTVIREKLMHIFREKNLVIPESEIHAILCYFL